MNVPPSFFNGTLYFRQHPIHAHLCATCASVSNRGDHSMHNWDNLIRHGLCILPWFSDWLAVLKVVCRFIRDERNELETICEESGMEGTKALLKISKNPPFAKWRWWTMHLSCKQLRYVLPSLRANFEAFLLFIDKLKDGYMSRRVCIGLTCPNWFRQFKYCDWHSQELYRASEWGTSCKCHEEAYANGEQVVCAEKGRLMPRAWAKVQETMRNLLNDANAWGC